jgi:AcrR family transcriptional regulator
VSIICKKNDTNVEKERRIMGTKAEKTREAILDASYTLFADKGFKQVTMKDVCETTGMSRGGLYSHFSGTDELFEAVLERMTGEDAFDIENEIDKGTSAVDILNKSLSRMKKEIGHPEDSLSIAICEYAQVTGSERIAKLNRRAVDKWTKLIKYGVERGEFKDVDVDEIVSIILYSYQGIRMWSKIMPVKKKVSEHIINHIKKQLIA